MYQKLEWVVCDSKILYLFGKLLKTPIKEAIPGSSFFTSYYMYHKNDADCKIFLLGAKEGIAAKAMEGVLGSGCYHRLRSWNIETCA